MKTDLKNDARLSLNGSASIETSRPQRHPALRWAYGISSVVAALMVAASAAGLLVHGLYRDGPWAREAFRGGDLVTLVVAAPVLIASLILSMRGSRRAVPIWIGMLMYTVYTYAFGVFGATFNDAFLLHIALMSTSIFALACALPALDLRGISEPLRASRAARWIGPFLVLVGIAQAGLWGFLVVRFAVTGELLRDIPVNGQHVVFALDLSLLMPALAVGGVLLYRRTPLGLVLGPALVVMGAVTQLNLMLAGVFQANADVAGVKAFPPESIFLTTAFVVASVVLLSTRVRRPRMHLRAVRSPAG
jgi:hypothetical protein